MRFQQTDQYHRWRTAIKKLICLPLLVPYLLSPESLIDADVDRWVSVTRCTDKHPLLFFLALHPEFRNIYNHRMKQANFAAFACSRILKRFYPEEATLHIYTEDIGPGLFIQHGFSTIIAARKIGANFHCNQQVTIGFKGPHAPTIGDDVSVRAGAGIFGQVCVGDGASIGAGAVVVKDVRSYNTVGGVPAKVLFPKLQPSSFILHPSPHEPART